MNGSHLPDDYSHWPSDPYQLLGLPRTATERDIKRAYTRLIRIYKPEHSPEEFRLIREAYEKCLSMAQYYATPNLEAEPRSLQENAEPEPHAHTNVFKPSVSVEEQASD